MKTIGLKISDNLIEKLDKYVADHKDAHLYATGEILTTTKIVRNALQSYFEAKEVK